MVTVIVLCFFEVPISYFFPQILSVVNTPGNYSTWSTYNIYGTLNPLSVALSSGTVRKPKNCVLTVFQSFQCNLNPNTMTVTIALVPGMNVSNFISTIYFPSNVSFHKFFSIDLIFKKLAYYGIGSNKLSPSNYTFTQIPSNGVANATNRTLSVTLPNVFGSSSSISYAFYFIAPQYDWNNNSGNVIDRNVDSN